MMRMQRLIRYFSLATLIFFGLFSIIGTGGGGGSTTSPTPTPSPEPSDIETETGMTGSDGHVVFTSDQLQREIDVQIEDQDGNPVEDIYVTYITNGDDLFLYVKDPNREYYSTILDKYDVLSSSSSSKAIFNGHVAKIDQEALSVTGAIIAIVLIYLYVSGPIIALILRSPSFNCFPDIEDLDKVNNEGTLDDIASDLLTLDADIVRICSDVSSQLDIHDGEHFDASLPPVDLSSSQIKNTLLDTGLFENATYRYGYYQTQTGLNVGGLGVYIYGVDTTVSPNFDVTGTWTGIWTNTASDASGDLQFDLTMDSSGFLTGSVTDVTNEITEPLTSGHVEGDNIHFVIYDSISGDNLTFAGEISDENSMSGEWNAGAIREDYGTWEVSLTDGSDVGDSYEPDDTYSEANTISTNGTAQSHTIYPAGDVDWVKFYGLSGNEYTIETSNLDDGCDTYLYLYSTDGTTEIDHDDDGGSGTASKIEWSCTSSGTYYVKARHYNSSYGTGSYDISVTESGFEYRSDGFESGDFSLFPWNTGGDGSWQVTSNYAHNGSYAAEAPVSIGDNESSYVEVTLDVTSAGNIVFWYKVSSENNYDYIRFKIDGVQQDAWSGEVDWTEAVYSVSSGTHTFRWEYTKDVSVSSGSDTAWIDDVVFP